jgi:hypothetical protein
MCDLCSTCTILCECPRCPLLKEHPWLNKEFQPCYICGLEDDRDCTDDECIVQDHCVFRGDVYCQICVENKYGFFFKRAELGMYCEEHEDKHKERMRANPYRRFIRTAEDEVTIENAIMEAMKPVFIEDEKESERERVESTNQCAGYIAPDKECEECDAEDEHEQERAKAEMARIEYATFNVYR